VLGQRLELDVAGVAFQRTGLAFVEMEPALSAGVVSRRVKSKPLYAPARRLGHQLGGRAGVTPVRK